jgi:hypothetical protein
MIDAGGDGGQCGVPTDARFWMPGDPAELARAGADFGHGAPDAPAAAELPPDEALPLTWFELSIAAAFVHFADQAVDVAVVDAQLSPVQQRNLEKEWGCKVIDRTGLKEHLAPTRANALGLMASQMKQRALAFASQQS